MEASFQRRLGLAEKRETQITIGCLEMIIVEKIMELLKRNATITPTLFTLIYSVEGVCVCMHACMYPHVCACMYFYPLGLNNIKLITSYSNI